MTSPRRAAADGSRIRVLLTVPHLLTTASPYREMMAIVKYLPREDFDLAVCVLRPAGLAEMSGSLARYGVKSFVARFRPTAQSLAGIAGAISDQRLLRAHGRIDVQHSLDFTSSPFEGLCARLQGRRYIYTQRNLNEDGHPVFLRQKIRLSSGVLAISNATHAMVRSLGGSRTRILTIPLGFDFEGCEGLNWTPSPDPPVILSVGHLQRRKRVEDAIRAIALMRTACPRIQLWVIGRIYDQKYRKELGELSDALGVADQVKFLGVREDVIQLMQQASALFHCADSEAFGWSILEAMAVGLPVVAYDSGGPGELIQHGVTGFLTKIGDCQAGSAHLLELTRDRALAESISIAARVKAKTEYTAEAFAQKHASFYREFVESSMAHDLRSSHQVSGRG